MIKWFCRSPPLIIIIIVIIIMVSPFLRFPFEVACDYPRALKTTFNFFSLSVSRPLQTVPH